MMNSSKHLLFFLAAISLSFLASNAIGQQYQLGFTPAPGDSSNGVLIESVVRGGPMTRLTSNTGQQVYAESRDVIVSANGQQTPNVQSLRAALANLRATNGKTNIGLLNHRTRVVEYYSVQFTVVNNHNNGNQNSVGLSPTITGQAFSFSGIGITAAPGRVGNISGMVIQAAAQGSPLLRMVDSQGQAIYAEKNDMIVAIGDLAISTSQDLVSAYQNAGQRFNVSLYDTRTGKVARFTVTKGVVGGDLQVPPGPGKIFVLIAGMIDPGIEKSVRVSFSQMKKIVDRQIQPFNLRVQPVELLGNYGPNDIVNAIQNVSTGPNDAVFVYYIGHGSYQNGEHVLNMGRGDLKRSTLNNALRAKGARLTVLITESCSGDAVAAPPFVSHVYAEKKDPYLLQTMLLEGRGVVDVNSSTRGQFGFGDTDGGYFSRFIHKSLELQTSGLSWPVLINGSSRQQEALYRRERQLNLTRLRRKRDGGGRLSKEEQSVMQAFQGQESLNSQINQMSVQ